MTFTNAKKQARWRTRHIVRRRGAQRIANILMGQHLTRTLRKSLRGSTSS
jgi:hypothetical protein